MHHDRQPPPDPAGRTGTRADAAPGSRGPKGERTRARIVASALELFSDSGFHAVSLRAIGARAGVSHVAVLRYFGDRDALLLAALAHRDRLPLARTSDADGRVRDSIGTVDGARRLLAATVATAQANAAQRTVVSLFTKLAAESTDPAHPAHAYFRDRYAQLHAVYARAFSTLLADRRDDAHLDPDVTADQLIAVLDGTQLLWLLRTPAPGADDPDALARPVRAFLAAVGLEPTPAEVRTAAADLTPGTTDGDPVVRATPAPTRPDGRTTRDRHLHPPRPG